MGGYIFIQIDYLWASICGDYINMTVNGCTYGYTYIIIGSNRQNCGVTELGIYWHKNKHNSEDTSH